MPKDAGTCPRCGAPLNSNSAFHALSRTDNLTHICSECGRREAIYQMHNNGELPPVDTAI